MRTWGALPRKEIWLHWRGCSYILREGCGIRQEFRAEGGCETCVGFGNYGDMGKLRLGLDFSMTLAPIYIFGIMEGWVKKLGNKILEGVGSGFKWATWGSQELEMYKETA